MKCPKCGMENPLNAKYCAKCGKELKKTNGFAITVLIFVLWIGSIFLVSSLDIPDGAKGAWAVLSVFIPGMWAVIKSCKTRSQKARICPKCGRKHDWDADYCSECGELLKEMD